ncbi:MAG: alpha/beta fold hydrolase [Chloroflexota bacterium]|nr:MAG: alpha/beta fold hydrolase [Chloroflexota bacterium]
MKVARWIAGGLGLLMVFLSIWQLENATAGLKVTDVVIGDLPVTLISPEYEGSESRPLVLIGHGVAGSRVIMRGYALTLAHAGYNVALWDFAGHGSNPQPLAEEREAAVLVTDAETALLTAQANGLSTEQVAVLGHSMGSGMALAYGTRHPETMATIAISPVDAQVNPDLPRNLLLLAEELDPRFVRNAEQLLERAGGPGGDTQLGTARRIETIPMVEHVTILFSSTAQKAARQWLDEIFGLQPGAEDYTDRRMLWYLVGLSGTLLFFWSLSALVYKLTDRSIEQVTVSVGRRIGALLLGALGATALFFVLSQFGLELNRLLGVLVGGYLMVWFAIAGAFSIVLLGRMRGQLTLPAVTGGLLVFAALWIGLGWLGNYVWLPWLLIPRRLILWPLGAALSMPWFLAVAQAVLPTSRMGRAAWWLGYSVILVFALYLAIRLNPELGFLILILPIFPLVLGVHALAAGPYRWRASFALGGALFVGWLLAAVFPLQ